MQIKVYTIDFALPRWLKRGLVFVGIPLLGLVGIGAVVRASVPDGFPIPIAPDYSKGDLLTADGLNTKFNDLRKAANTLASSIDSVQTSSSTAQSQISTISSKLATGDGVKASALVCPGCDASSTLPRGSVAFTVNVGLPKTATLLAAGAHSGWYLSSDCKSDETPMGGGCIATLDGKPQVNVPITLSFPENRHWVCSFRNNEAVDVAIEAVVWCAKAALVY